MLMLGLKLWKLLTLLENLAKHDVKKNTHFFNITQIIVLKFKKIKIEEIFNFEVEKSVKNFETIFFLLFSAF